MPEAPTRAFSPRTIRIQLTFAVTAVVALVVALSGLILVMRASDSNRADVDRALATRAAQVRSAAAKSGSLPTDGTYAVRLLDATGVRAEAGAKTQFSTPVKDGYSTVTAADGSHWRSWAETLKTGAQMQILMSLTDVEDEHSGNVMTINLLVLLAALVAAAGTWLAGDLILRPLARLVGGSAASSGDRPINPASPETWKGPVGAEDATVLLPRIELPATDTGNGVSGRPATASEPAATERFAAEVGEQLREPLARLGDELDQLLDQPEMPATQRHLILAAIQTEHRRIGAMLDDIETRARGTSA
ncbi:hypothetical protein [Paractinoplanes rishiriensis]|uniref:Histidine kinase n=1 Tax=Paractinoplanes rishiriensis TaxID=1050105 RepID=A0A919K8S8_9ACTN|nr:hypothetical protein [Actinoplanes rishiriensis]GIF01508.1 hypothetical protein Ari01nite_89720 [Actinoplanes rishiriensis]